MTLLVVAVVALAFFGAFVLLGAWLGRDEDLEGPWTP